VNVRLIKLGTSAPEQKHDRPIREVQIADTIQSWVREFRSMSADRARLNFKRISNSRKS
jgi:hypothetical protein